MERYSLFPVLQPTLDLFRARCIRDAVERYNRGVEVFMAALELSQFLKKFSLYPLGTTATEAKPGCVLSKGFLRRGFALEGHLAEVLTGLPGSFWESEQHRANLVYGTLVGVVRADDKGAVRELGVRLEGLAPGARVQFAVTEVRGSTFRNAYGGADKFLLASLLNDLRRTNPDRWRKLGDKWIVMETYYPTEIVMDFEPSSGRRDKITVHGHGKGTWQNDQRLVVTNSAIPIAFSGFKA